MSRNFCTAEVPKEVKAEYGHPAELGETDVVKRITKELAKPKIQDK
jgi:hypothetical protein